MLCRTATLGSFSALLVASCSGDFRPDQTTDGGDSGHANDASVDGATASCDNTATTALSNAAAQWDPGMQSEGACVLLTGVIAGAEKDTTFTLQGGKCYAIVAVSPSVVGFDLQIMLPNVTTLAASDTTSVGVAVAGKGANAICPLTPLPIPYTVRVIAKVGSGDVSVQLFSKLK